MGNLTGAFAGKSITLDIFQRSADNLIFLIISGRCGLLIEFGKIITYF